MSQVELIVWSALYLSLAVVALAWAYATVRKSLFSTLVSVVAETSQDEKVSFNINFSSKDSAEEKKRKFDEVCQMADVRREESFKRLQDAISKAEEEQAEKSKLKSVGK